MIGLNALRKVGHLLKEVANAKTNKREEEEVVYLELLQAFRKDYLPDNGWELSVIRNDKEGDDAFVVAEVKKDGKSFAVASVLRGSKSYTDTEREAISEVLVRFGVFPDIKENTEENKEVNTDETSEKAA